MEKLNIHFPFLMPGIEAIPLARALRVGGLEPLRGPKGPEEGQFDRFNREIPEDFSASGIDEADVVVFPHCAKDHIDEVLQTSAMAKERGLPAIFISWGDANRPVRVEHGTVYGQSLIAGQTLSNERAVPAFCSDVLAERHEEHQPRAWQPRPSVGFCGFVSTPFMRLLYRLRGQTRKVYGLSFRIKALDSFHHPDIQTHFIRRTRFLAAVRGGSYDVQEQFKVRKEFLDNLLGSDYSLCCRGAGNFSIRFYETLAAGRIPLMINTRCVLPLSDEINWKEHCVWVEEEQMKEMPEILLRFHRSIDDQRFRAMQISNRRLWEEKLSGPAFTRNMLQSAVRESTA